jgi:hypothetical protein
MVLTCFILVIVNKNEKIRLKETLQDSDKALLNRNIFFQDVFNREKNRDVHAHDVSSPDITSPPNEVNSMTTELATVDERDIAELVEDGEDEEDGDEDGALDEEDHHLDEDEEKFLRALGWVPEDEYHVPVLEDAEIDEARKKLHHLGTQ